MIEFVSFEGVEVYRENGISYFNDSNGNIYLVINISNSYVIGRPVSKKSSGDLLETMKRSENIRADLQNCFSNLKMNRNAKYAGVVRDSEEINKRNSGTRDVERHNRDFSDEYFGDKI